MTDEGDKVTISIDMKQSNHFESYKGLLCTNGLIAGVEGKSILIDSSKELSLSVQGDLNDQELKDVQKAIQAIDKIMQSALSGKIGNAFTMVKKVGDLEFISAFKANLKLKKNIIIKQTVFTSIEGEMSEPTNELDKLDQLLQNPLKPTTDQILDVIKHAGVSPVKMIKPLNQYLSKLFEKLSEENPKDSKIVDMGKLMKSELLERIKKMHQEKEEKSMETEPINEKQLVIDNNETSLTEIQTELDAKPEVDPDSSMMDI